MKQNSFAEVKEAQRKFHKVVDELAANRTENSTGNVSGEVFNDYKNACLSHMMNVSNIGLTSVSYDSATGKGDYKKLSPLAKTFANPAYGSVDIKEYFSPGMVFTIVDFDGANADHVYYHIKFTAAGETVRVIGEYNDNESSRLQLPTLRHNSENHVVKAFQKAVHS